MLCRLLRIKLKTFKTTKRQLNQLICKYMFVSTCVIKVVTLISVLIYSEAKPTGLNWMHPVLDCKTRDRFYTVHSALKCAMRLYGIWCGAASQILKWCHYQAQSRAFHIPRDIIVETLKKECIMVQSWHLKRCLTQLISIIMAMVYISRKHTPQGTVEKPWIRTKRQHYISILYIFMQVYISRISFGPSFRGSRLVLYIFTSIYENVFIQILFPFKVPFHKYMNSYWMDWIW